MKCCFNMFVFISFYFLKVGWDVYQKTHFGSHLLLMTRGFIKCDILLKSVGEIYEDFLKKSLEHKSIAMDKSNEFMPSFWKSRKAHADKYVPEGQNQL